jgi:hypothetical protein
VTLHRIKRLFDARGFTVHSVRTNRHHVCRVSRDGGPMITVTVSRSPSDRRFERQVEKSLRRGERERHLAHREVKTMIKLKAQEVFAVGCACCVCDGLITDCQENIFVVCHETENLSVCEGCLKGGIEKIDRLLREKNAARRKALPKWIAGRKEELAALTAELQDESITLKNSLVGRLEVPSYAEWLVASERCLAHNAER